MLGEFLNFLSKEVAENRLEAKLPAEVAAFALMRNVSLIDENEIILGKVDT